MEPKNLLTRYVSALISGVGIFCLGAGLSVYHGVTGLLSPEHSLESIWLAMGILGISFLSESFLYFFTTLRALT